MYDTHITIVGNVLNPPEWRRTANTGTLVTTFKIASTARRLNRESGQWVDGNSLRVRVSCWRALASNVASSVTVGDPLIVTGRLFTRDWLDEDGNKRTMYELEATAIGHDLTRGKSRFERIKANTSTSTVEDAQAWQRVGGELTVPVPADQAPAQFDETPYHVDDEPVEAPVTSLARYDAVVAGSADSTDEAATGGSAEPTDPADPPEPGLIGDPAGSGSGRRRGVTRPKVAA